MKKVDIVDCVKQIIAINKELEEHDQRQDYHVTWMAQLRDRIEKLEKLQASSSKQQATSLPQSCGTAAGKQKGKK